MQYEVISLLNVSRRLEENDVKNDNALDIYKVVLKNNDTFFIVYFLNPIDFGIESILEIKEFKKLIKNEDYKIIKKTEKIISNEFIDELIEMRNKKHHENNNVNNN